MTRARGGKDDRPARAPRGQKSALFQWVDDQQQLDMRTKFILKELAAFADADCCCWSKVETLAYTANCSPRTVQYHLKALVAGGLMTPTGRMHRLDGSTRSVPIYRLAPAAEGLGAPEPMGAKIAPIEARPEPAMGATQIAPIDDPVWVQSGAGMGAIGLHPVYGNHGEQERDKSLSPGARALEDEFAELEAALPRNMLKFSDRDAAFDAFCGLAAEGVGLAELVGCARRMVADPMFKTRKFPPTTEVWLVKRMFRGWAAGEDAAAPDPAPAAGARFAGPEAIRQAFAAAMGDGKVASYLDPCRYEAGPPARLVARTGMAADWLRRQRAVLKQFGLTVELGRS